MANGFIHDYIMYPIGLTGFAKWYHQFFVRKLYGRNKRYRMIDRQNGFASETRAIMVD